MIILVFLIVAIRVAEQAGVLGGDVVAKVAKNGMYAPFKAVGAGVQLGTGYLGRRWNEITANKVRGEDREVGRFKAAAFAVLNPPAFLKGMKKRQEELSHAAQAKAESAGLEVAEQRFNSPRGFLKGSKKIIPRVLAHEKHEEDEFAKGYMNMSRELVARTAHEVFQMADNEEGRAAKRGIIKVALAKGYIDDIVMEANNTKDGRKMLQKMIDNGWVKAEDFKGGVADVTKQLQYNNRTRRAMYKAMFGDGGHGHLKDHAAMRLITEEGEEEGMSTGHLEYMTDFYFDAKTGNYMAYELDESTEDLTSAGEAAMAAGEIAKRDSRTQARIAWHSLMSSDGKRFNKAVFTKIAKALTENPGFMQERTANMLIAGTTELKDLEPMINNFKNTGILDIKADDVKRIKKMVEADPNAAKSVLQRFLNDRNGALTNRLLAGGKLRTSGGEEISFKMPGLKEISSGTINSLQEATSEIKVSADSVYKSTPALQSFDSSTSVPELSAVVSSVEAQGVPRTDAVKIAAKYVEDFTSKRISKLDVVDTVSLMTPATNFSAVEMALSPQTQGKFSDVLKEAVRQGVVQGSKYTTDAEKENQIKIAIEKQLGDKDVIKQLDGQDLRGVFNSAEYAKNVYSKVK